MVKRDVTTLFKSLLLQFVGEEDPLLSMLQWTTQLMKVEAENKIGSEKGKHALDRRIYFPGYRWRRFDTRLGTTYLCVPKLRNNGYIPFFVVERKRSEQALIQVIQEAFIDGVSTRKVERLTKALGIEGMSARSLRSPAGWTSRWKPSGVGRSRPNTRCCGWMPCTRRSAWTGGW